MTAKDIAIAYCLVTIVHLIATGIHRHVRRNFHDPETAVAWAMLWPVADVTWLVRRWCSWRAAATMAIVAIGVGGASSCVYPYRDYLYSLPVTDRTHGGEAIAIVSEVYGIDYRVPEVRWIVQEEPLNAEGGGKALGTTHDCVSWVWWQPAYGADPKDSLLFGKTPLAHELAHCALWLYRGDGDGDHSDVEWWGPRGGDLLGGLVGVAMDELTDRGL